MPIKIESSGHRSIPVKSPEPIRDADRISVEKEKSEQGLPNTIEGWNAITANIFTTSLPIQKIVSLQRIDGITLIPIDHSEYERKGTNTICFPNIPSAWVHIVYIPQR